MKKKSKVRLIIKDADDQKVAKLAEEDVGIIIRKNLDIELFIPNRDANEIIGEAEMHGFAIMMALGDPDLSQQLMDFAEKKMDEAEKDGTDVEVDFEFEVPDKEEKDLN